VGKNYTFDKRFSHGAEKSEIVSHCVHCDKPWDRYQVHCVVGSSTMGCCLLLWCVDCWSGAYRCNLFVCLSRFDGRGFRAGSPLHRHTAVSVVGTDCLKRR
jgi:hypothetical protein